MIGNFNARTNVRASSWTLEVYRPELFPVPLMSTPKKRALVSQPSPSPKKRRLSREVGSGSPKSNGAGHTLRNSATTTPTKSRVRALVDEATTPTKPGSKTADDGLTPVKRAVRDLSEQNAETESTRIMTRGARRARLAQAADEEEVVSSEEEDLDEEEAEDEDEEDAEDMEEVAEKFTTTASYENFFQLSTRRKKSLTSNNTMSLLPTLTPQESTELLDSITDHHAAEIKNLHEAHRQQFPQWKFEIDNGYNILLFGYGSKRAIMEDLAREMLAEAMPVLVVNGYFANITLDGILTQILAEVAPDVNVTGDKVQLIQSHLNEPLALIIHCLDSPILRLPKNQQILSSLAANKHIKIIASVDHVNAPLLFDSLKASRYNFLWHDCTTFVPLRTELSYEETTFLGGGTSATASVGGITGIKNVLNNLTANARALYKMLLENQLPLQSDNNEPAGVDEGIAFPQLRTMVSKKILPLSTPQTLKAALGEFYDHGLLVRNDGRGTTSGQVQKSRGSGEIIWAPFGKQIIEKVIEFLRTG
jgi:origin recognition complex subunit 2